MWPGTAREREWVNPSDDNGWGHLRDHAVLYFVQRNNKDGNMRGDRSYKNLESRSMHHPAGKFLRRERLAGPCRSAAQRTINSLRDSDASPPVPLRSSERTDVRNGRGHTFQASRSAGDLSPGPDGSVACSCVSSGRRGRCWAGTGGWRKAGAPSSVWCCVQPVPRGSQRTGRQVLHWQLGS